MRAFLRVEDRSIPPFARKRRRIESPAEIEWYDLLRFNSL